VSLNEWVLALHLLGAFAEMGAITFFAGLIIVGFRTDRPSAVLATTRLVQVPTVTVIAGMVAALVFGLWLAISLDAYHPWDGWVIAAIVLLAVSGGTGARGGDAYARAEKRARELLDAGNDEPSPELAALMRDPTSLTLNTISTVAALLILLDMIWKPGAPDVLASIRPDSWNFPLFLHVFGAMVLVGGVFTSAVVIGIARGDSRLLRIGYFSLLAVGLPGYVAMRIGAQWIYSKEGLDDAPIDTTWATIGFIVADAGAVLLLISLITGGIGIRRLDKGGGKRLLTVSMLISIVLLAAFTIAVWAMGAKPT
jgi:uncharacterized membrane protein